MNLVSYSMFNYGCFLKIECVSWFEFSTKQNIPSLKKLSVQSSVSRSQTRHKHIISDFSITVQVIK